MQIHLIAVGMRMPQWVQSGYEEYAKRLPRECQLVLREIEPAKRSKTSSVTQMRETEAKRIVNAIPKGAMVVALDVTAKQLSTEELAIRLEQWMGSGQDIAMLIGGPDGLDDAVLELAEQRLSLSRLTFPHPIVRVIIAEQLYRAWSVTQNHPYHRA